MARSRSSEFEPELPGGTLACFSQRASFCLLLPSCYLLLTSCFSLLASRFLLLSRYLAVSSTLFDNALRLGGEALSTATTAYA
jgi:hypothetical protein